MPCSLSDLAALAFARRISHNYGLRFYVLYRNRSCTNNCSFTNCDTWAHERIRTNPRVGANHNRRTQQRKIWLGMIVCSRAKMRAMRDGDARPQRDAAKIVDERLLANRAFISGLEIPREINRRRWINMHTSADLCPETAKQESSPTETRPGTKPEKRLRKRPKHAASHLARSVLSRPAIFSNVQHRKDHHRVLRLDHPGTDGLKPFLDASRFKPPPDLSKRGRQP